MLLQIYLYFIYIAQIQGGIFVNPLQVSETIKKTCKFKNITIKEMLELCNINRNFIYDLKNNRVPSADKFEAIADYLDCSVDYLLGRTDNPEINK